MGNHKPAGRSGISVRTASQLQLVFLDYEILPPRPPNQEMTSDAAPQRFTCSCRGVCGQVDMEGRYVDTSHTGGVTVFNIILMEFLLYYTVAWEFTQTSGGSKGHELLLNLHTLCPRVTTLTWPFKH